MHLWQNKTQGLSLGAAPTLIDPRRSRELSVRYGRKLVYLINKGLPVVERIDDRETDHHVALMFDRSAVGTLDTRVALKFDLRGIVNPSAELSLKTRG